MVSDCVVSQTIRSFRCRFDKGNMDPAILRGDEHGNIHEQSSISLMVPVQDCTYVHKLFMSFKSYLPVLAFALVLLWNPLTVFQEKD